MKCSQCGTEMTVELTDVPAGWKQYDLLIRGVRTHACKACGHEVLEPQDARMVQELSRALSEMTEKPEILDVSQVADLLRVSIQTVYNQVKAGKLPAVKIGREWRFTRSAVMQMLTKTADASPNIAREAATTVYGAPEDAADAGTRPNAAEPTDPTAWGISRGPGDETAPSLGPAFFLQPAPESQAHATPTYVVTTTASSMDTDTDADWREFGLVPRVDSVGATQDENAVARGPFSR